MGPDKSPTEMTDHLPTGRRRPHKKSRTGCNDCRKRRCDEKRPACTACVRRDHQCVYPSTGIATPSLTPSSDHSTPASALQTDEASLTSSLSVPRIVEGYEHSPSSATTFVLDDLALLHHWTVSTSLDIVKSSGGDHYWQRVFPQIAFQHAFVMHGILSLAALHLAYRQPADSRRLICIAAYHHNIALQGFRQGINQMSDDNSDALFVCSSLNILYVLAIFGPLCDDSSADRKSRILGAGWIPAIRGVDAVLYPVYERVRRGPLSSLTDIGNWDKLDPNQQSVVGDDHFRSIQEVWRRSSDAHIYDQALYLLRKCNAYMRQFETMSSEARAQWGYNQAWSAPYIWLHTTPKEYLELLQQRQPPALLIFAYFGTLAYALDEYWFMEGWGRNMVDVTDELLGAYWDRWMKWPKDTVGIVK
ncbi:Aspercryptin biosynthesis cluster-specific transcription regulator atnN [Fusarium oxysporum f. sp. albedinis]|nr:Aspercryptin biosynthesis cluster-specific transcription regulator atnN [Fusarium oxysporum f. sp. albedinis]